MKHYLLLSTLLISINLSAQYELDINNVSAHFEQNGQLFANSTTFSGGFEAPAGSDLHTFYTFNFWVGGINNGLSYAHGARFLQLSDEFLRFGPMMDSAYYETENEIWDRVWNITKLEIYFHITDFDQPGYIMPEVIENWPVHGDITKGQAVDLAPFVDVNNDGIYTPAMGDYPRILGDQAIYVIYNGERSNELMAPMGIETHVMLYSYANDEMLDEVVFAYVKHYNRSPNTYINAYLGMFNDFDIGNSTDDISFTDVNRSTLYAQNGDAFDEDGYESVLPYQSTTVLRGVKQDNDGLDNNIGIEAYESVNGIGYEDGIIDNEYRGLDHSLRISNTSSAQGDPQNSIEYYNTMAGFWRYGDPVVYGGDGYTSDSTSIASRFVNSNNDPDMFGTYGVETQNDWNNQIPSDIRMIGSSGPFIFHSGSCRDMYTAFVFERPNTGDDIEDFDIFTASIDYVKENFETIEGEQCSEITTSIRKIKREDKQLFVYPNPFNNAISFNYEGSDVNAKLFIYDLMGREEIQKYISNGLNTIDLTDLVNTTYLLKLVDKEGIYTQKIIKR